MASIDIYEISSSPPRAFNTYSMSSPLPSPGEILKKKPTILRAGSRAVPVPQNATTSFTSASSLLRMNKEGSVDSIRSFALGYGEDDVQAPKTRPTKSKPRKAVVDVEGKSDEVRKKPRKIASKKDTIDGAEAKPRKPRVKKAGADGEDIAVKKKAPRKSRAKRVEGDPDAPKEKTPRKSRARKTDGDQMQLPKAQVTKSLGSKGQSKTVESNSKAAVEDDPFADSLDYGLDAAIKRRSDWTPPPPTKQLISLTTPVSAEILGAGFSSGSKASVERSNGFQDLLGNFAFSKLESEPAAKTMTDAVGVRKRKLIELVATNTTTAAPKAKAPKKKARTVTEAATSAYVKDVEDPNKASSLLQYFSSETIDKVTKDGFKVPPKPRSRSPIKGGKGSAQAPILLSPESALKQVVSQEFVFGTSSQLAREESPGFLRDIHAAMQASNEADLDDPFASPPTQFGTRGKTIPVTERNLWSVAARDSGGKLLDVEMVDLSDTPAIRRHSSAIAARTSTPQSTQKGAESWHDIEELLHDHTPGKTVEQSPKSVGPVEAAIRLELLSSPASSAKSPAKAKTPSKGAAPKAAKAVGAKSPKSKKSGNLEMPDFEAYTMNQLTKEVASYHFKPVKSRDQMISLLEKCWESKQQRLAMVDLSTNLPISPPKKTSKATDPPPSSQAQLPSPIRARGRPRKDDSAPATPKRKSMKTKTASLANALARAQKKAEAVDEIFDSDTAITPSPPRRHASQIGTPPLPLQLSSSASIDHRELSPGSSQVILFKHITKAVMNDTPSKDSSNPSWHEKVLLYDPIILDDLTVWLNTGALEKVGWDDEVDPKEVKKWCESKSICCLWRESLRNGTRNRY